MCNSSCCPKREITCERLFTMSYLCKIAPPGGASMPTSLYLPCHIRLLLFPMPYVYLVLVFVRIRR